MKKFVLLFQCKDQKGIVATISDCILKQDGNIITADQYSTDPEGGHFFLRIEFCIDVLGDGIREKVEEALKPVVEKFNAVWRIFDKSKKLRMGVFVSRPDHCLNEILYLWRSGELRVDIPFVASSYGGHWATVEQLNIPFHYIDTTKPDKDEKELIHNIVKNTDFLVLARYMHILSKGFLDSFQKDIINIHHSFLPSFKGADPYRQAFARGVKVIGATAHFATEALDEGPIISQMVEPVTHRDDVEELKRKGKNLEKYALIRAIRGYLDYRIMRFENKTIVF